MGQTRAMSHAGNPITLDEYRELDLKRPLTDTPIGGTTNRKRDVDAVASAIHTENDSHLPTHLFDQ
jgi:hypothetical protein